MVDVEAWGSCCCTGFEVMMMGDGSAEVGFDTGDGGEVRICTVGSS